MKSIAPLLLSIVVLAGSAGAAPPDFSGTWILNRAKSTNVPNGVADALVITVNANRLKIKYATQGEEPYTKEWRLDGSETSQTQTRSMGDSGLVIKMRLRLEQIDGGARLKLTTGLEFEIKNPRPRPGVTVRVDTPPTVVTDVLDLVDGGKGLRIDREDRGDGKEAKQAILVFDRR